MIFLRYVCIQVVAYVIDIGSFVSIIKCFAWDAILANVIGKIAAGLFAFTAHRAFTFCTIQQSDIKRDAIRYSILLGLNTPLSSFILDSLLRLPLTAIENFFANLGVELVRIDELMALKFIADVACLLLTYWLSKTFVFINRSGGSEQYSVSKEPRL